MKIIATLMLLAVCVCPCPAAQHLASKAVVKSAKAAEHVSVKVAHGAWRVGKFLL